MQHDLSHLFPSDPERVRHLIAGPPRGASIEYQQEQLSCLFRIEALLERLVAAAEAAPAPEPPTPKRTRKRKGA